MKIWKGLGVVLASAALISINVASAAVASGADPTFQCVVIDADTCQVTIPLVSNMNEQVGSTMPDGQPWYMSGADGNETGAAFQITGPGNDQTTWDGVGGALQGTVWTAILTTSDGVPAGALAYLTFAHVAPTTSTTIASQPYQSIYETFPQRAYFGTVATITAVVKPMPAKGNLALQHKSGANWVNVGTLSYSVSIKKWVIRFKWRYAKHTTQSFRLLAKAAPGLITTYGGTFKIASGA